MALENVLLPGVLLLALAGVVGVVLLLRSARALRAGMLAILVVAALTPATLLTWDRSPLVNPTQISVDGLAAADAGLDVTLAHHLVTADGTEYQMVSASRSMMSTSWRGAYDAVSEMMDTHAPARNVA